MSDDLVHASGSNTQWLTQIELKKLIEAINFLRFVVMKYPYSHIPTSLRLTLKSSLKDFKVSIPYSQGPIVVKRGAKLADVLRAKYAVTCNSGTAALHMLGRAWPRRRAHNNCYDISCNCECSRYVWRLLILLM